MTATSTAGRISLDLNAHVKFSVWVSFCEIYNENIHDLLEVLSSGASRRTVLRLSQDIMGRAFVKGTTLCYLANLFDRSEDSFEMLWHSCLFLDLCWVQVDNVEEAYKILVIGKKNQSFSATRLNHLSSRRWLKIIFQL